MAVSNNSTIDRKNKIIGVSVISAIALILVGVIVISTVLTGSGTVTSAGNLMEGVSGKRSEAKITDKLISNYYELTLNLLEQHVQNYDTTSYSIPNTVTMLSFLADASKGKTQNEILNLIGTDYEAMGRAMAKIEKSTAFQQDKKFGVMSSSTVWLNSSALYGIRKSFLKSNAKNYGIDIQRQAFSDTSVSDAARETVTADTIGRTFTDVKFTNSEYFNIVSGATFNSEWVNMGATNDTFEGIFTGNKRDYDCSYFTTIESKYISGSTYSGAAKEYVDGYTFIGLVPKSIDDNTYYTLSDVIEEVKKNKLLPNLLNTGTTTKVKVTLPYYTNSVNTPNSIELSDTLKSLGVTTVFNSSADLSGMAENAANLHLDNFYISGDISLTPAGSVNAYTDNKVSKDELAKCKVSVDFMRSFIYFIYDNESGLPIYLGVVNGFE